MAEGSENPDRSFLSKMRRGDGRPVGEFRRWMNLNWATMVMLIFIFLLALFVRSYFAFETSADNGYIVSGGSDSYYWRRIIDYSADTGKQLYWDPLTAYPDGIRNPRPPLFSMSVVVPGVLAHDLFGSVDDSVGFMFVWSTAFWGALTVIPVYFLGKEVFGRRAGLVAAFFLAVMPSHVQRSVLSNADHDSIILFFIVLTFYFLLRAVKTQQQRKWVESYKSPASIRKGFVEYARNNRTSMLYSLMAGTGFASVIMTWVGFGYAAVLILAYYIIQVFLNKFKGLDSFSVTMIVFITMGFGFLLSWPVYIEQSLIVVRFDVPVYLFLAAMFFGALFVVTRDLPWTITLPAIIAVVVVGVAAISVFNPALGDAILSGQGYFVKSKLYSTIAEARAPRFSELAMSFGMVTFFMSLIGLIWAIIKIPKQATAEYIFIVVWLAAAIFMAISAGRFMFNAAPAFAIASAWVLVIIVDRLDFDSVRRSITGASGSYWQVLKKSVKIRHIVGALFLGFLIVLPNVWYSVDAGIPSETKHVYDKQIYLSFPNFMRPKQYDINETNWYLGAFGYSLPLPSYYFPAAWDWFSQQDEDLPPVDRPAFVAWWDYGFEAIQEGKHPTVADNFQNGYQLTGNALMAQNEYDAIAIFAYKLIEAGYVHADLKAEMHAIFEEYNVSVERMDAIVQGPAQDIIDDVLSDSGVYGPMATDLSVTNARIVAGRVELVKAGPEKLVSLYADLCDVTGWSIRYFMADSRMMPLDGQSTGIFYAPAKLSDRRITGSTPTDFYQIRAVLDTGAEVEIDKLQPTDTVVQYKLLYQDMFWDSMFYRAFIGYSGSDIGLSNDGGVVGWRYASSSQIANLKAMPGWNMTHFKMVYRTAYYNPYPLTELAAHRDAWTAVSLEEALVLKQKISAGEIQGYVDDGASSYYTAGAVFLKYYPGVFINGTLTTEQGDPVSGVHVTVVDEYGIPHQLVETDNDGKYSVIAPAGNITIAFTTGSPTNENMQGSNSVATIQLSISEDQAMRLPYDLDRDGSPDYVIAKDVIMKGVSVTGDVFWDNDAEGNYSSAKDELILNAVVYADDIETGKTYTLEAPAGSLDGVLPPGQYDIYANVAGRNVLIVEAVNVTFGETSTFNIPIVPGKYEGYLFNDDGSRATGVELVLTDFASGYTKTTVTDASGSFAFSKLLAGKHGLTITEPGKILFDTEVTVVEGVSGSLNATMRPSSAISYRAVLNGYPAPYAVYSLMNQFNPEESISGQADEFGMIDVQVPKGEWALYANYFTGSERLAAALSVSTVSSDVASGTISFGEAAEILGSLRSPKSSPVSGGWICFEDADGTRVWVETSNLGVFRAILPVGGYGVTVMSASEKGVYSGTQNITKVTSSIQLNMVSGALVSGAYFAKSDVYLDPGELDMAAFDVLKYRDSKGNTFSTTASYSGTYSMVFPLSTTVQLSSGELGYSQWSQNVSFSSDVEDYYITATPDAREVSGYVTYNEVGLRDVQVKFLPSSSALAQPVIVNTGPGGYFSALVPPSEYSFVIDQDTGPFGGERYQYSESVTVSPGNSAISMSVSPMKRVEVTGFFLGGGSRTELKLEGPDEMDLNFTTLNYTLYALPGTYSLYASTFVSGSSYANISSVEISISSREHDIQLAKAYALRGRISIGASSVNKQVDITATASIGSVLHTKSFYDGSYTLNLPKGSYSISYLLEDTLGEGSQILYVEYFYEQSASITSSEVVLNPSLALRMDNSTFSGRVLGPDGTPQAALVEMFVDGAYGKSVSFMTQPSGEFSEQVQPGDYSIYVTREQDRRVALVKLSLVRNQPKSMDITLSDGSYLSGKVTVAGSGAQLSMSLTSGGMKLALDSDETGAFETLLSPMNYTISATTSRLENGLTIAYSGSTKVTMSQDNVYVEFSLNRDSRRSVSAAWNKSFTQSAQPGVEVTYVVQITNTGNTADTFIASYTDSGAGVKVTSDSEGVVIGFGGENVGSIEVTVNAGSKTPAGETKIPIQIRSKTLSSVRSLVDLYLNVATVRSVTVKTLNESKPVTSMVTMTKFTLNNTGNAQDKIVLRITNLEQLNSLGWNAEIVEWDYATPLPSVDMPAFHSTPVGIKFTAIRANPDPTAEAMVLASSSIDPTVASLGSVPVRLPDLSLTRGGLNAERSDVAYDYDYARVYLDMAMLVALVSLVVGVFYLRRKKGLGGRKDRGGAKK